MSRQPETLLQLPRRGIPPFRCVATAGMSGRGGVAGGSERSCGPFRSCPVRDCRCPFIGRRGPLSGGCKDSMSGLNARSSCSVPALLGPVRESGASIDGVGTDMKVQVRQFPASFDFGRIPLSGAQGVPEDRRSAVDGLSEAQVCRTANATGGQSPHRQRE